MKSPPGYYPWLLVNSPLPFIRAMPAMQPENFAGAWPNQGTSFLTALAVYRPT